MTELNRQEIFRRAAEKMRQDFEELSSVPHNALKGREAEEIVKKFLTNHLPRRFGVGSGFIIDPTDAISRQTDIIIYDAFNCPIYRSSDEAGIYPSHNVASVIEVKSRLTSPEFRNAWINIHNTKSLAKRVIKIPGPVMSQTYGCIFAFNSDLSLDTVSDSYAKLITEFGIGTHPDLILIYDKAVFTLACKFKNNQDWFPMTFQGRGGESAEGSHIAISHSETGVDSLDYFLRLLLAYLDLFSSTMDHPGFDWIATQGKGKAFLRYITSITNEKDPNKARELRASYREQAKKDLKE